MKRMFILKIVCEELFREKIGGKKVLCSLFFKKKGKGNNVPSISERNPSSHQRNKIILFRFNCMLKRYTFVFPKNP